MRTRRLVALAAFGFLLLVLIASSDRPGELGRRARVAAHESRRDLAVRRLDGSSTAFDRRFFYFLESARRSLPADARGVAVRAPSATEAHRDLAAYDLAPLPVLLAPRAVPPGWLLAVYGSERPAGWREVAQVPGGAVLAREP